MSDANLSILELVEQIQVSGKIIIDHLQQNSLPSPSLAADAYPFFPGTGPPNLDVFPRLNENLRNARTQIREACATLTQLVAGAGETAFNYFTPHYTSACMQFIYHFRLAEHIPPDGEASYSEVAAKAGVSENKCTRVLKYVMTQNVFRQSRPGYVAHTAISRQLLIPDMRDAIGYATEESFIGASKLIDAVEKFSDSQEKNATSWNLGHNTDLPIFEFFEKNPARMARFMGFMRLLVSGEGYSTKSMIEGFDWRGLGKGLVVDVGGSFGHCSFEIAEVAPDLNFIVQDLDAVAARAEKESARTKHVDRVKFQGHNFFTPQPVKHADVYMLRFICHDHSDKYAAQILRNITPAMGPNSTILIVDTVMPEAGGMSKIEEAQARVSDMEMMLSYNSLERDEEAWKALVKLADPRLEVCSIKKSPYNTVAVQEVRLK